jgi:hypothetical protein
MRLSYNGGSEAPTLNHAVALPCEEGCPIRLAVNGKAPCEIALGDAWRFDWTSLTNALLTAARKGGNCYHKKCLQIG